MSTLETLESAVAKLSPAERARFRQWLTAYEENIPRRSITDVLADAPGRRAFQTADDVDAHVRAERDAWEQ